MKLNTLLVVSLLFYLFKVVFSFNENAGQHYLAVQHVGTDEVTPYYTATSTYTYWVTITCGLEFGPTTLQKSTTNDEEYTSTSTYTVWETIYKTLDDDFNIDAVNIAGRPDVTTMPSYTHSVPGDPGFQIDCTYVDDEEAAIFITDSSTTVAGVEATETEMPASVTGSATTVESLFTRMHKNPYMYMDEQSCNELIAYESRVFESKKQVYSGRMRGLGGAYTITAGEPSCSSLSLPTPSAEIAGYGDDGECGENVIYEYTASFDDLQVPYIPVEYNSLKFSHHFSSFEPAMLHPNYTAPTPPYAAISYLSRSANITSHSPFDLVSMYVGCKIGQACIIRMKGWSPYKVSPGPAAELELIVPTQNENWTFVEFGGYGFLQLTLMEFEVLDIVDGRLDSLSLTVDEMRFVREGC